MYFLNPGDVRCLHQIGTSLVPAKPIRLPELPAKNKTSLHSADVPMTANKPFRPTCFAWEEGGCEGLRKRGAGERESRREIDR